MYISDMAGALGDIIFRLYTARFLQDMDASYNILSYRFTSLYIQNWQLPVDRSAGVQHFPYLHLYWVSDRVTTANNKVCGFCGTYSAEYAFQAADGIHVSGLSIVAYKTVLLAQKLQNFRQTPAFYCSGHDDCIPI